MDFTPTPAQLALAWVLRDPAVASTLIGASSVEQLERNAAAADIDLADHAAADEERDRTHQKHTAEIQRLREQSDGNERHLLSRIDGTVAFLKVINPGQIDGTEDKAIVTKRGDKETHYKGMQFLLGHAMPNVYFHVTTAFAILRHNGVEIGKRDFLGNP